MEGEQGEIPFLVLYFHGNSIFPAISTPSECVFNVDSLVMTKQRKNMIVDMHGRLVIMQDYLKERVNVEELRLCLKGLQPPSKAATYKVSCMKHDRVPK